MLGDLSLQQYVPPDRPTGQGPYRRFLDREDFHELEPLDQEAPLPQALQRVREGTDWEALEIAADPDRWPGQQRTIALELYRRVQSRQQEHPPHWTPLIDVMVVRDLWPGPAGAREVEQEYIAWDDRLDRLLDWGLEEERSENQLRDLVGFQGGRITEILGLDTPRVTREVVREVLENARNGLPGGLALAQNDHLPEEGGHLLVEAVLQALGQKTEGPLSEPLPHNQMLGDIVGHLRQRNFPFRRSHLEIIGQRLLEAEDPSFPWYIFRAAGHQVPSDLLESLGRQAHQNDQDKVVAWLFGHGGADRDLQESLLAQSTGPQRQELFKKALQNLLPWKEGGKRLSRQILQAGNQEVLEQFVLEGYREAPELARQGVRRLFERFPEKASQELARELQAPPRTGWTRVLEGQDFYWLIGWLQQQGREDVLEEVLAAADWLKEIARLHATSRKARQQALLALSRQATAHTLNILESEHFELEEVGREALEPFLQHPDPDFRRRVMMLLGRTRPSPSPSTPTPR